MVKSIPVKQRLRSEASFVQPPKWRHPVLRFAIWLAEKFTGNTLLPARVLLWYPKSLIGSGVLEALVAHNPKTLGRRLLKLVRIQTSIAISCPFCIDMNALNYEKFNITKEEIEALQSRRSFREVHSLNNRERLALEYARSASGSPLEFKHELIEAMQRYFSGREMVILASTIAQVNYWGRLIQALGIPPAGFSGECSVINLSDYSTLT